MPNHHKSGLLGLTAAVLMTSTAYTADRKETSANDWYNAGKNAVAERLNLKINEKRAKNVILFIGDGMGISTLTAGRIFEGQQRGETGEENYLSFEKFPYTALVKTYNTNAQVPDSAGTASAINTGVKTRIDMVNTAPHIEKGTCSTASNDRLVPLAEYAERAGMKTGIVTTARISHATPAAVYAFSGHRGWESDKDTPDDIEKAGCQDIVSQITHDLGGDGIDLALGGGRSKFLPVSGSPYGQGSRDKGDIVAKWLMKDRAQYVSNRQELLSTDLGETEKLLGLFNPSYMEYELDRTDAEPSLTEMTETAINFLSDKNSGYYLMIEGGRIDHGHHAGNAQRALGDTVEFSNAVRKALSMVDLEETLVLVTADHSHVFTIAGYPERGNPILGLLKSVRDDLDGYAVAEDGKPYTTLGYHNGPGAVKGERPTITQEEALDKNYKQQALIPTGGYESHGGEDVALFGIGPWSHLVRGTIEQNVIFHIMYHALGLENRGEKRGEKQ